MDVERIRYLNLQTLIEDAGGLNAGGLTRVAEKLGKSQGQLSHIGGAKPIKNIGSRMARQIEAAYGLERGWMDAPHGLQIRDSATVRYLPSQPAGPSLETMTLAADVTRFWMDLHGLQGTVEDHIPLLAIAHDLVLEARGAGLPGNVMDLSKRLAARLRQQESSDGDERGSSAGPGGAGSGVRGRPARRGKGATETDRS